MLVLFSIASLERNLAEIYDFMFDRLRAVRQDLVIQEADGGDTIDILEKAIRFHLYSDNRYVHIGVNSRC